MNSVYIDSAVAAIPIYIGPNNASSIIIGNTNCSTIIDGDFRVSTINSIGPDNSIYIGNLGSNVFLYNSTILAINESGIVPTSIETVSETNSNNIDFHSSGTNGVNFDTRFRATGGSAVNGQGTFEIVTNALFLKASTIYANGSLIMGTACNITLQPTASIVAPTAFTQLGGTSKTESSITLTLGSGIVVIPTQITTAGTYLFTFGGQLTYTTAFTFFFSNIFESSAAQTVNTVAVAGTGRGNLNAGNYGQQNIGSVNGNLYMGTNGSFVYTVPESKVNFYYSFALWASGGGTLGSLNSYMTITRLA